jgi:hypothetical protein
MSNSAELGGGVYVHVFGATLDVSGGAIGRNSADTGGGMYIYAGSATLNGTRVYHNRATTNGGGLYLASVGTIAATNGCIVFNSDTAVHRESGTLSATDNWWGTADGPSGAGPGGGDSVSTGVDYASYKTSPPAGCITIRRVYLPLVVRDY